MLGKVPRDVPPGETCKHGGRRDRCPGLLVYRFDAPLFFGNADVFRSEIRDVGRGGRSTDPHEVLVNAEAITDLDTTGVDVLLRLLREDLDAPRHVTLAFARVRDHRPRA